MEPKHELKPDKRVFLHFRFLMRGLFFLVFFTLLHIVINIFAPLSPLFSVLFFIVVMWWTLYALLVRFKKEKYLFFEDKIIRLGGGVFSDFETELVVRNITHVRLRLPFLAHKFFAVGTVRVESAGSSSSEIVMRLIGRPNEFYQYVEDVMKHNGFRLSKKKLVQQEKPSTLGAFFEIAKIFGAIFFVVLVTSVNTLLALLLDGGSVFLIPILLFILLIVGAIAVFRFLDLKRRVYSVFEDTITYEEGFLAKVYSFIPIENLADSSLTQTFIDKIFGLYDVRLSCQGSGQEVHFKNIEAGKKLEQTIDDLINKSSSLVGDKKKAVKKSVSPLDGHEDKLSLNSTFTAEFRMDKKRTLMPLLFLLPVGIFFFPIYLFLVISLLIKTATTSFTIKKKSVEFRYNFINQKTLEFSNDKIMGVVFKESFIDKWFGTCSIHFWSIGSSENIIFSNIKKTDDLFANIKSKIGVFEGDVIHRLDSKFSFSEMLKANFPLSILSFLLCVAGIVCAVLFDFNLIFISLVLVLLYWAFYAYKKWFFTKSKLRFYQEFVSFQKGIFFKSWYYVPYKNIKDIVTIQYPASKEGSITFNVAGETMVQSGKNQVPVSSSFRMRYVDKIALRDDIIDMIFFARPSADKILDMEKNFKKYAEKPIMVVKPALGNSLFVLFLVSIIVFPLILLLPITIPFTILAVRRRSYGFQSHRVIAKSGVFYKRQISIIFKKIDYINNRQGALNKLFKNGNIIINTAGSSTAEMVIKNIREWKQFYEELKKRY